MREQDFTFPTDCSVEVRVRMVRKTVAEGEQVYQTVGTQTIWIDPPESPVKYPKVANALQSAVCRAFEVIVREL